VSGIGGGAPTTISKWLSKIGNNTTFNSQGLFLNARVISTHIKLSLVNLEGFPVVVTVIKVPFYNAALFSSTNITTLFDSFVNSKSLILDKAGTSNASKIMQLDVNSNLLEGRDVSKDTSWRGTYAAIVDYQGIYVQIRSMTNSQNLLSGVDFKLELDFVAEFSGAKITTD